MKSILLALRLFSKNYKTNIAIIIQIMISTLILLTLFGKLQGINKAKSITDIIQTKNALYIYMYDHSLDTTGKAPDEFYDTIKSDKDIGSIGEIKSVYFRLKNGQGMEGLAYNDAIINNINIKLQKGTWFTDKSDDYIPIISVGSNYKLNETVTFSINPEKTCEGKIIGIIENGSYVLTFNSGGSKGGSSLSYFTIKANDCFVIPQSYLSNDEIALTMDQPGKMVFMSDNVDTRKTESALSEYGAVSNVEHLKTNYNNEISEFMITNGTAFLFFLILVLAGIGGNNAIQKIRNEKTFSIYYILGLTTGKCAQIEALRGLIIFVLSFIAAFIAYNIPQIRAVMSYGDIIINTLTFLFVFIYLILIYLISSVVFVYKVLKLNPIVLYRKKD